MIRVVEMTVEADRSERDRKQGIASDCRRDVREAFPGFDVVDISRASETTVTFELRAKERKA